MGLIDDIFGGAPRKNGNGKKPRKPRRFACDQIYINRGGYADRGRRYFGVGSRLYRVTDKEHLSVFADPREDPETQKETMYLLVRADSCKMAIAKAKAEKYGWTTKYWG